MDKYLVPLKPSDETPPKSVKRHQWKRSEIELNGRLDPKYRREMSGLLMHSYSQVGMFPHLYHIDGVPCDTHVMINRVATTVFSDPLLNRKKGISSLDFDNKGYYLASVTKSGCLGIHDFEALYCHCYQSSPCNGEIEAKDVMHISLHKQLDVVRWNILNQDEVACASTKSNEVLLFDIGYESSEPIETLQAKRAVTARGSDICNGFTDIAFSSNDASRLFASDTYGAISVWDRRASVFPCLQFSTNSHDSLNSIQLNIENQVIFSAGMHGMIYMWDLRGGRTSAGFQGHREVCNFPLTSIKVAAMLGKIESLKAQSDIVARDIQSIDLDPSYPHQLGFHLDDGWSGILDIYNLCVTHIHCPPPAWLNGDDLSSDPFCMRKPSWLPTDSIYVVGSACENGVHFLDFFPDSSSPCHVDLDDMSSSVRTDDTKKQNKFLPLPEGVTVCASHPRSATVVAGTKHASLIILSQKHASYQDGDDG